MSQTPRSSSSPKSVGLRAAPYESTAIGVVVAIAGVATMFVATFQGGWLDRTEARALGLSTFAGLSTTLGALMAVVRTAILFRGSHLGQRFTPSQTKSVRHDC
jgi:MFS-type transporter involved in bile tolerance (Atg22 family)